MDPHDLSEFSGELPLFPLPNVVLFPQTVLPLHIFEPRYREMMEQALAGEKLIAMGLLKPGWEPEYYGNPEVHNVVGVGRILSEQKLEDGRFNLLLYGLCRARLVEVVSDQPFRIVRVEVLKDRLDAKCEKDLHTTRLGLLAVYTSLLRSVFGGKKMPADVDIPLGTLCDLLAAFVDVDVREKQHVMEELDVASRVARVVELLKRSPVSAKPFASGPAAAKKKWPPEFYGPN